MAISDEVDEAHAKIVDDGGEARRSNQRHDAHRRQFRDGAVKDRKVCMSIQTGWIDDAIRHGSVLMQNKRPRPREGLAGGFRDIRRHSHPDGVVLAEVNKAEIRNRLNLCIAPRIDLFLLDREIAREAIAPITQDRFQEAESVSPK